MILDLKQYITKYWKYYLTVFLVIFSISHSIIRINKPFGTGHFLENGGGIGTAHLDNINARQGTWNENFIQNGYLKTKFGKPEGFERDKRCIKDQYFNHPSLGPILYSLPVWLLGNEEWAIRIVPLLIFLFNLFLLYKIISHIFDTKSGLIAVIIYSFFPVNRVYNMLPDFYGPLFFTYTFLIIYFIFKYDQREKTRYKISFFVIYFLSLLHEWFSIVNIFIILFYYLFFKRKKIYEGLFFLVILTNVAFLLNFLHIYLLTGSWMVDELIGQFRYRAGELNFINSILFSLNFQKAFGMVAILLAIVGIFLFFKIKNKKFKLVFYSQVLNSLFFLVTYEQAFQLHWFLFINFSLFIILAIFSALEFCKERGYFIFKLLLPIILFLIILNSQFVINEYYQEDNSLYYYDLIKKFLETAIYNSDDTLVLLRNSRFLFFQGDYYLAKAGYCLDLISDNPYEYNNLKGFKNIVFIELDENNNLKIEKIK